MRKYLLVSMVFILAIMISIPAYAQSAKDAVMALKKLQARCQSGISYRDYSNALADAKFPVNLFMESANTKKSLELTESISKAMKHYEYAGTIWYLKMSTDRESLNMYTGMLSKGYIEVNSKLGREIISLYPQSTKLESGYYSVDFLLPMIWDEASKELDNTIKLLAKTEETSSNELVNLKKENEDLKVQVASLKKENEALKRKPKKR